MDDLTVKIRAQYLERIIWIVIILILLIALVVVYFQKCPDGSAGVVEEEEPQEMVVAPEPDREPAPLPPPREPEQEQKSLSGTLNFGIKGVGCELKTSGNNTLAKVKTVSIEVDNQKSGFVGALDVYIWDTTNEEVSKDTPITGDDPVRLGRIDAGTVLRRDILQREVKTATIGNSLLENLNTVKNIKIDLRDADTNKILLTAKDTFKVEGSNCKLL
ncbi:hypothetical protein HYS48_00950 [Candidatus Woesearchaeota archaeon]|nr:hypothetical protein [Candidatus Woesearchaeota archaeon]